MVTHVTGRSIRELYLADFLADGEAKTFLKKAETLIKDAKYLEALIEIRKAIFVEFELAYAIYGWRDHDGKPEGLLASYMRGGWSAPPWTRNKKWIDENVRVPTDYVQIDSEKWRIQAMELGIHTEELQNLQRLTPDVFRSESIADWCVKYDSDFPANDATEANAKYCLDRAIAIILKKQEHSRAARPRSTGAAFDPPPIYLGRAVHKKASTDSDIVHMVSNGFTYTVRGVVTGFNTGQKFYEITGESDAKNEKGGANEWVRGFLQIQPEDG